MSSPDVMVPPEILDAIKARLLESVEQGMENSRLSPIQLDLLFHADILDVRSRVKQMIQDRMKDMQYIEACRVPVDWTRTTQEAFVATERKLRVRDSTVDGEVLSRMCIFSQEIAVPTIQSMTSAISFQTMLGTD